MDRDSYLLELCRYVVLNPIRAGMVDQIECFAWSSYPATMGLVGCPAWLETDWVLGQFAKMRATARCLYAKFVEEGEGLPSPWTKVRGQALLGTEAFVEKMRPFLEGACDLKEIPRTQRFLHRPSMEYMFTNEVNDDKILRNETIRKAFLDYGYSMITVARHAKVHYSTVSKIIRGR